MQEIKGRARLLVTVSALALGFGLASSASAQDAQILPPVRVTTPADAPKKVKRQAPQTASVDRSLGQDQGQGGQGGEARQGGDSGPSGFTPQTASIGPFANVKLLDTPYSIDVVDQKVLDNQQVRSLDQALKYVPSAQLEPRGGIDVGRPQSRGFEGDTFANTRLDGMNIFAVTAQPLEMIDHIEVVNGLTGAFYGPANPAGMFNFVAKRPTDYFLNEFTTGYSTNGGWLSHADVGGRVGPNGFFGYRLNFVNEEGSGYVSTSHLDRKLASGAFDFRFSNNTVLEVNASYYNYQKSGYPGGFSVPNYFSNVPTSIQLPKLDPTQAGYGQEFTSSRYEVDTESAKIKHDFGNGWNLTAGVLHNRTDRFFSSVSNAISADGTKFTQSLSANPATPPARTDAFSNTANLNGKLDTYGIGHEVVLGTTGYRTEAYSSPQTSALTKTLVTNRDIYDPLEVAPIYIPGRPPMYKSSDGWQQSVIVGDTITLNRYFSAMAVGSYSWIGSHGYNASGVQTSETYTDGFSPTAALMFKPLQNITTYVAYADSLQKGDTLTAGGVTRTLDPYRSEQYEAGVKAKLGGIDARVAIFQIERPFAYVDGTVVNEAGNQRNQGVEFQAGGQVYENIHLLTGVTFLDPKLLDAVDPNAEGKQIIGVPEVQANILVEYYVPWVENLVASANVHYVGERAVNNVNTSWADAFTTVDLGARYETEVFGRKTTLRLNVNNVFDEKSWAAVMPGSIIGDPGTATKGANTAFLGSPREVVFTGTVRF
ncbi:TonB-dependent siderophore receptor [Rhodomicrobium vannielii ATCC 17100]|uniref:TonB-dependent siderophore receptor n=2 Tax=Rhodomicrobium vannielii TaxID=1069 RepID=E3HYP0_RHOVT|nr:TonB-dependent siderophore receptor [Rhodomicrobium vannielii ATCC 17100]